LERELVALERLIEGRGVAIDVGANEGVYTYKLSQLFKRVEAFEPQPQCIALLTSYKKANVRVHPCALSDGAGEVDLRIPIRNGVPNLGYATVRPIASDHQTLKIVVRRLDDFHFEGVSFIKIDVEGHESKVLAGAEETISRERPVL